LAKWLNESAANEIEFPPGIVRVVFDNEQVIGKRYRVKANQTSVPTSVTSSSVYLSIDKGNNIQTEEKFQPSNWMFDSLDETTMNALLDSFGQHNDTFRMTRNELLAERINVLMTMQEYCGDKQYV